MFSAKFACFRGCGFSAPLTAQCIRCPDCGSLLDVEHDTESLQTRVGQEWRTLFSTRTPMDSTSSGSGVWAKKEWVYPGISEESIVTLGEGFSPLLPSRRLAKEFGVAALHIKQCGVSHTGSFKDLGMTVLVSAVAEMRRQGREGLVVGCASTGDTSAALAAYCAAADIPCVVLLPEGKISTAQLLQPLANHARVLALDTDFDGCMRVVQELADRNLIYLANSMNPLRLEGQKTAAIEMAQQLGWEVPDFVVIPGGNLGNVYAFGRGFQMMKTLGLTQRVPRLVVAQAARANPLYRSFKTGFHSKEDVVAGHTEASAIRIGAPVSMERAIRVLEETDGIVEEATEQELANAAAHADRAGFYCDPHTGVALAVTGKLCASGAIPPQASVVVVSTAHGLKFTEHKVAYHDGTLEDTPAGLHRNQPVRVPADASHIAKVLADPMA